MDRRGLAASRWALAVAGLFVGGLGIGALFAARGGGEPAGDPSADGSSASGPATSNLVMTGSAAPTELETAPPRSTPSSARASQGEVSSARLTPIVEAARRVGPSVVAIRTTKTVQIRRTLFDEFFGRESGRRMVPGLGSGFVIDRDGTIITNHHVVRDADSIEVIDRTGARWPATVVGSDEFTDLAVVRMEGGRLPAAPLGTSADLMVGEPAIAIGNPSGFLLANAEATVTSGVVSGIGRDILSRNQEVLYADMIQTDAAINPGNSGGPLVNAEGRVIGVNSSIFSLSGGSEGLGFAIPIDRARHVTQELLVHGRVRRPWVGANVVTQHSDSIFRVPVVDEVIEDTPAAQAGLRRGDVIVSLNGRPVEHDLDWQIGLVDIGVDGVAELEYRRGSSVRRTRVELAEIPSARAERVEVLQGLRLVSVTPQIVQERGLAVEFGALIFQVDPGVTRNTGLRAGDVIYGINGNEVRTAEDAGELFEYYARARDTRGWVRVHLVRGRSTRTAEFRVG